MSLSIRHKFLLITGLVLAFLLVIGGLNLAHLNRARTTWTAYLDEVYVRYVALHYIQQHLGYGAGIHDFKDFVLRADSTYLHTFDWHHAEILSHIDHYRSHPSLTPDEATALNVLESVVNTYKAMSRRAAELHREGASLTEIDLAVEVDDAPAEAAIQALQAWNDLQTGRYNQLMTDAIQRADWLMTISLVMAGGVLLAVAFYLRRGIHRPILALSGAVQRVAGGMLDTRVDIDRDDEIGELGACFNAMTEELEHLMTSVMQEKARVEASEDLLKRAESIARLGGWSIDLADQCLHWTAEVYRIHEIEPDTPVTLEQSLTYYPEAARKVLRDAVTRCATDGTTWDLELPLITSRGAARWVRIVGERDPGEGHVIGMLMDITLRKQAELNQIAAHREVESAHSRLRAILDGTTDAIAAVDTHYRYLAFNEAYCRLHEQRYRTRPRIGLREGEGDRAGDDEGVPSSPDALSRHRLLWDRALAGESFVETLEVGDLMEDGTVYELSVSPLHDEDGTVMGAVHVTRDVTDRARVERLKSDFISVVNHELRTPLTSLTGALALIQAGTFGDPQGDMGTMLDLAVRNAARLGHLIDDLLDLQRISAGELRLSHRPLKLRPFLEHALAHNRSYETQFDVRFVLHPDLPDTSLYGDEERLGQVMTNLLSNAAKFSPRGSRVEVGAALQDGWIRISVHDEGPGIPESFRPHVFEPFRQGDASIRRRHEGTGLGLSLCKSIIDEHDGRIGFEVVPGSGTTFYFDLPVAVSAQRALGLPIRPGASILICEDDSDAASTLTYQLRAAGYETDLARTGREAEALVAENAYDLITLDLKLPDVDGMSLLQRWRQDARTRDIPVLIISGYLDQELGLDQRPPIPQVGYLRKPLHENQLVDHLTRGFDT